MTSVIVVSRTHIGTVLNSFLVRTLTTITEVGVRLLVLVLEMAECKGRTPSVSGAFTTSELVGRASAGDGIVGGMLTLVVLGTSEDLGRARLGGAELLLLGTSEDLGRARLGGALLLLLVIARLELVLGMTSATFMLVLVLGLISMLMPVALATLLVVARVMVSPGQLWMVVTMVEVTVVFCGRVEVTVVFCGRGLTVSSESSAMVSASPALTPFRLTLSSSNAARNPNDFIILGMCSIQLWSLIFGPNAEPVDEGRLRRRISSGPIRPAQMKWPFKRFSLLGSSQSDELLACCAPETRPGGFRSQHQVKSCINALMHKVN
jgi:hypothetical protein